MNDGEAIMFEVLFGFVSRNVDGTSSKQGDGALARDFYKCCIRFG